MPRPLSQVLLMGLLGLVTALFAAPLSAQRSETELLTKRKASPKPALPDVEAEMEKEKEKAALPIWTKPDANARTDLGKVTRSLSQAILLVGYAKAGHEI